MSSLVPVERGIVWSLNDCFYGNEEKERKPVKELVRQFNQYPGLLEIALGVEGLVCRRGQHASGVMMYNNSPFETTALMRSPNGDITTQFDLKKSEEVGDTKFDFLVTDICDKISVCLDLLQERGYFNDCKTKREIYNKYLHPQVLNLKNPRIWEALANGEVQDVFQFNTQIGIETAKAIRPHTPAELTSANALLRLVAPPGQERPLDRYITFKNDINLWYKEMTQAGLTSEEQKILEPYYKRDYGVPCSQEMLMLMVMDPKISHFTLAESNQCRKVLAKKKIKEIPKVKEKFLAQCPTKTLGEYAWKTMMEPQMSYSFSEVHSLLYSFIGIQTLVLATQWPSIYWNCACLIVNSQSIIEQEQENDIDENEFEVIDCYDELTDNFLNNDAEENDDEDDDDDEELEKTADKKKKKQKTTDYGRIATAIGKMRMAGIEVAPPDINKSTFTFSVDQDEKTILYGMSGISGVGEDVVKEILTQRPYAGWQDFITKVKVKKPQMINLIKCGAFDEIEPNRVKLMKEYIASISDTKQRITLQNMAMLISFGLIPEEFDLVKRVYNFNKYLKRQKKVQQFQLDNISFTFYEKHFDMDLLTPTDSESGFAIDSLKWDKIYQKYMDQIRPWVKQNSAELLEQVNERLMSDMWNKYCLGSLSKWEMDSISCYQHQHELENVDFSNYNISNFYDLNESPTIDRILPIKGKEIPIFKIYRIAGTVLDRDKQKKTITLLTTEGVVIVKIFGEVFSYYDKQISEKGVDGHKHIIRKSDFSRGNKLIITGIRRDESFQGKKYKSTPYHLVDLIQEVREDGTLIINNRRDEGIA